MIYKIKTVKKTYTVRKINSVEYHLAGFSRYFIWFKDEKMIITNRSTMNDKTESYGKITMINDNGIQTCLRIGQFEMKLKRAINEKSI